MVLSDAFYQMH